MSNSSDELGELRVDTREPDREYPVPDERPAARANHRARFPRNAWSSIHAPAALVHRMPASSGAWALRIHANEEA